MHIRPTHFLRIAAAAALIALPCATLHALDPESTEVLTPSAQATKAAEKSAQNKAPSEMRGPALLTVAAIVILGAYIFLRRTRGNLGGRLSQSAHGAIQICRSRSLGGKQYLVVVQVEGKRMLIGMGPGFMTNLCELEPEDFTIPFERKEPPARPEPREPETPTNAFNNLITRINDSLIRKDTDQGPEDK